MVLCYISSNKLIQQVSIYVYICVCVYICTCLSVDTYMYMYIYIKSPYRGGGLVAKSCPTLVTPWAVAHQAPLSTGFSRQEYWSGLPFPSPGDLPDPGIKTGSPALQADSLLTEL